MAAAYGLSPREVLRWPWVHFEEWWLSHQKRQRRKMQMDAMTRGMGPLVEGLGDGTAAPAAPSTKENGGFDKPFSTWYGTSEVFTRRPTDADNWDIPQVEISKLALTLPGCVNQVQT